MIKAIIFDFFGVICSDEYWNFVKVDKNMETDFHRLADAVNLGTLSWKELVEKIANETKKSPDEVERMFESQRIHPALIAYVDKLHSKYNTALLTNASEDQFDPIIKQANLDKIFDEIVISSKLGIAKPDPRIFEYTLNKLAIAPEEAVFIDDLSKHVDAAKGLGIRTILYKDFNQLKAELDPLLA